MADSVDLREYIPESCADLLEMADQELKSEIPALARDKGRMNEVEQAVKSLPSHHELYQADARDLSMIEDESVHRQLTTNRLMEERGIELPQYPSIMGWEPWHYERCRILVEEISRSVGFDATQYNSKFRLAAHVNALDEVLEPDRIFINGRVSAEWLRLLPKSVVACSGSSTIREKCEDEDGVPQRAKLPEILEERIEALNSWQSDLTNYL